MFVHFYQLEMTGNHIKVENIYEALWRQVCLRAFMQTGDIQKNRDVNKIAIAGWSRMRVSIVCWIKKADVWS